MRDISRCEYTEVDAWVCGAMCNVCRNGCMTHAKLGVGSVQKLLDDVCVTYAELDEWCVQTRRAAYTSERAVCVRWLEHCVYCLPAEKTALECHSLSRLLDSWRHGWRVWQCSLPRCVKARFLGSCLVCTWRSSHALKVHCTKYFLLKTQCAILESALWPQIKEQIQTNSHSMMLIDYNIMLLYKYHNIISTPLHRSC